MMALTRLVTRARLSLQQQRAFRIGLAPRPDPLHSLAVSKVVASERAAVSSHRNEVSARFAATPGELFTAGAGCFWGTEKFYQSTFQAAHPGAITFAAVGFMGPEGSAADPSYEDVCSGETGHVEVVHLKFDPARASYEELVRHFFTFHDPTTMHRQGNDIGSQYASALFYHSDAQRLVCERVCADLQRRIDLGSLIFQGPRRFEEARVRTALMSATTFFAAESHHQQYLERKPHGYCNHRVYFDWAAQPQIV